jgi:hypothetical protein
MLQYTLRNYILVLSLMQEAIGWEGCSYLSKIRYVALAAREEVSRRLVRGAASYLEE